jgi:hypothetical protein
MMYDVNQSNNRTRIVLIFIPEHKNNQIVQEDSIS